MAPSGRIMVFVVLILAIHLTEPKDGYSGLAGRGGRRASTRRTTYRTTSGTYSTYGTGSHGTRAALTWWQICLIIGGSILGLFFVYCCYRAYKHQGEPESDTPGINTTRDQIQLRDHKIINHSPTTNYQQLPCSNGREIPPPPQVHNQPTPLPYPPQPAPYPPPSAPYPPPSAPYPPPSAPYLPVPYGQPLPVPMVAATAPPPTYDDALDISKEPFDEGAVDRWEDEAEMNRKDFGVI